MEPQEAIPAQESATMAQADPAAAMVVMGFLILYGAVQVFFGYRLMRFLSKVHAALLLGAFGAGFCQGLGYPYAGIGVGLVLAVVGYKLGDIYYYVNMIALGLIAGGALGYVASLMAMPEQGWLLAIIGAVVGAILTVRFERPLGIFLTSVLGSIFVWFGVVGIRDTQAIRDGDPPIGGLSIGMIVLATLLGVVVQARTTRNMGDPQVQNKPAAVKQ